MKHLTGWRVFIAIVFSLYLSLWAESIYPVNAAADESVELTVGREVYYGTYSTNYFDVDGKMAYIGIFLSDGSVRILGTPDFIPKLEVTPYSGAFAISVSYDSLKPVDL